MSVIVLLGCTGGLIVDLGGLRKKVLNTLSNFELRSYTCAFSQKVIFSIVKDLFK